jgi:hypothetical protein
MTSDSGLVRSALSFRQELVGSALLAHLGSLLGIGWSLPKSTRQRRARTFCAVVTSGDSIRLTEDVGKGVVPQV